jgi:hypothetical protein
MKKYSSAFNLKHKFPGYEAIQQNYSQTFQDMFAITMANGKRNGFFLEIGAQEPIRISNSYLLESVFDWRGISIDWDTSVSSQHKEQRKNIFVSGNALEIDYSKLLADNNFPKQIDYLQIDIDPSIQSYNCLAMLPLNTYRFSAITFEHDAWRDSNGPYVRSASRTIFERNGYVLIAGNISNESHSDVYEDWWVDPTAVDPKLIEMFKRTGDVNMPGDELLAA